MKLVKASQDIIIPDDVKLEVKSRKIRVTGPRGEHDCLHFYTESCRVAKAHPRTMSLELRIFALFKHPLCVLWKLFILEHHWLSTNRHFDP